MSTLSGRERVVQKYDPRGVLCAALLWGVVLGLFMQHAAEALENWLGPGRQVAMTVIMVHVVVLWYAAVPLLLARITGRKRVFIRVALATNLGMFVGSFAAALYAMTGFGADPSIELFNLAQLIAFGITSLIAVTIALGVRWLYRLLVAVPVEQQQGVERCAACAYEIGTADPCPECGTLKEDARPPGVRLDAAWRNCQRCGRPLLTGVVLCAAAYAGVRIWCDHLPTRRFFERFGGAGNSSYAYIDVLDRTVPGAGWYHNSIGATVDLQDGTGRMILVSFNGWASNHLPVMQVRVCAPATMPAGWPAGGQRMTDWGVPSTVVADLNCEQAERVIRDGLPQGLINAIVAKADEIGWKPGGGMQNVGGARLVIDAAPYFNQPAAGQDALAPVPSQDSP